MQGSYTEIKVYNNNNNITKIMISILDACEVITGHHCLLH